MKAALVLFAGVVLICTGCSRAPQTKEAVRQAVIDHVAKNSGLEVGGMDISVVSVAFEGKSAKAQVAFQPKGSPEAGMRMAYTLESEGNKWVVKGKGASPGGGSPHGTQPPASGALPPGHPVVPQR